MGMLQDLVRASSLIMTKKLPTREGDNVEVVIWPVAIPKRKKSLDTIPDLDLASGLLNTKLL